MGKFRIHSFKNVFDVTPTFLLPVFTDGDNFFFQKIDKDIISDFVDAELRKFSDCPEHKFINENKTYSAGNEAVYAIGLPDRECFYGNRKDVEKYYYNNIQSFFEFPKFIKYMQAFIETGPEKHMEESTDSIKKIMNSEKYPHIPKFVETNETARYLRNINFGLRVEREAAA